MAKRKPQPSSRDMATANRPSLTLKSDVASDFKAFYTNFAQVGFTFFDVSIMFGENTGVEGSEFLVENKARVTMSPTEAKILLRVLDNTIKQYEAQFGPFTVPEKFMPEEFK